MKTLLYPAVIVLALILSAFSAKAQEQEKPPTAEEVAATESERLEKFLKLEDWQVFYVDSTLQHDFVGMETELKKMQEAKVGNYNLYLEIQDQWYIRIENSFKKYFTEAQWNKFLKSGMSRGHKDSYKRRLKAARKAAKAEK